MQLKALVRPAESFPMECFYHEGAIAVGSCRACFRGLCRGCAVALEGALACRDRCEENASAVVASVNQSVRYQDVSGGLLQSARGLWRGLALVAGLVGVFVALWGLSLPTFREVAWLSIPFFGLAFLTARISRSMRPAAGKPPGEEPAA